MHRTPNASDILVRTQHLLPTRDLLHLGARVADQILGHREHLLLFEIPHTHGLLAPVDVVCLQHRVARRPRRDPELGAWVLCREAGQQRRGQEVVDSP